jgi:hypothetical protein
MAAIQLSFSFRTSSTAKTAHLLGSWDNYSGQLPLAKDKASSKPGAWKGTFRFQGTTLQPGRRYWYYYIIDGYHVTHDPAQAYTTEPTTGHNLNILDVPSNGNSSSSTKHSRKPSSSSTRRESRAMPTEIPRGRPLSVSQIISPKPINPAATKNILKAQFPILNQATVGELTNRFTNLSTDSDGDSDDYSSASSCGSTISSRSGSSSAASSLSSYSSQSRGSACSCERYGITRSGDRIKLDCGGSRCGYEDDSCCSSSDDEYVPHSTRRYGVVIRR